MASLIKLGRTEFANEGFVILVDLSNVFLQMLHQSELLKFEEKMIKIRNYYKLFGQFDM